MSASREDISNWYDSGKQKGATHMIVACDTYDHENYPVYVMKAENLQKEIDSLLSQQMTRYDEVYSYSEKYTKEFQFSEHRAVHLD